MFRPQPLLSPPPRLRPSGAAWPPLRGQRRSSHHRRRRRFDGGRAGGPTAAAPQPPPPLSWSSPPPPLLSPPPRLRPSGAAWPPLRGQRRSSHHRRRCPFDGGPTSVVCALPSPLLPFEALPGARRAAAGCKCGSQRTLGGNWTPGNRCRWASSGSAAGGRRPAQPPAGPATQQARLRRASCPTAGGRQCHRLLACPYGTDAIGHSHPSNSAHPRQKTGLCVFTAKSLARGSISVTLSGCGRSV